MALDVTALQRLKSENLAVYSQLMDGLDRQTRKDVEAALNKQKAITITHTGGTDAVSGLYVHTMMRMAQTLELVEKIKSSRLDQGVFLPELEVMDRTLRIKVLTAYQAILDSATAKITDELSYPKKGR